MKKFTLLLMSLFLVLGTVMAQKDESNNEPVEFGITWMSPEDGSLTTSVGGIMIGFTEDVTVNIPEGGIDVVNNDTKEAVKITGYYEGDEYYPKNQVQFLFEQKLVPGKDGKEELQSLTIETPGSYSYTIPAGCIKSVDGDEFPETTFTFSIVATFPVSNYSPMQTTTAIENIVLTFEQEITKVQLPDYPMSVLDVNNYWAPIASVATATIGEDKKTVTLVLDTPINTPGQYELSIYQGVFSTADAINAYSTLRFNFIDTKPSFSTTYEDGDVVEEIGNVFEITFKNVEKVELIEKTMSLYLPSGAAAEGKAECADNKITVTFDHSFTEEGEYLFYIPAGMFTMDSVKNEERNINVEVFTFEITPLEVVGVTPVEGAVDQIERIVVKYNQLVRLAYDENWQQISQKIYLVSGEEKYPLTLDNSNWNLTDEIIYLVGEFDEYYEFHSATITTAGTYTLNLADIIVDYASEDGIDEWGYPATIWHATGNVEGTYTWTIGEGEGIKAVDTEDGEQVIYDLLGRRVEKIAGTGIYIVNGKKMIVK